jgi:hypothetical protein
MTTIGNFIKDAWLFGILPETETCENWKHGQLQVVSDEVKVEWDKYGCLVSRLPENLRQSHTIINDRAIRKAREPGWGPMPPEHEL